MDPFLLAAGVLILLLVSPFWLCAHGDALNRLVGLETASTIACMVMLLLSVAFDRPAYADLALALALLSYGGGLAFARFLERWL